MLGVATVSTTGMVQQDSSLRSLCLHQLRAASLDAKCCTSWFLASSESSVIIPIPTGCPLKTTLLPMLSISPQVRISLPSISRAGHTSPTVLTTWDCLLSRLSKFRHL